MLTSDFVKCVLSDTKMTVALDALTVIVDTVMPSILIPWIVLLVAEV